jgi:hypothetical protein
MPTATLDIQDAPTVSKLALEHMYDEELRAFRDDEEFQIRCVQIVARRSRDGEWVDVRVKLPRGQQDDGFGVHAPANLPAMTLGDHARRAMGCAAYEFVATNIAARARDDTTRVAPRSESAAPIATPASKRRPENPF